MVKNASDGEGFVRRAEGFSLSVRQALRATHSVVLPCRSEAARPLGRAVRPFPHQRQRVSQPVGRAPLRRAPYTASRLAGSGAGSEHAIAEAIRGQLGTDGDGGDGVRR